MSPVHWAGDRGLDLTRREAVRLARSVPLRRLVGVALYLAAGIGVILVTWPGRSPSGQPVSPPAPFAAQAIAFPAPPAGSLVAAREAGANVVAFAVRRARGAAGLASQVSVVGPQGSGVDGLHVTVAGVRTETCGRGCYGARIPTSAQVRVEIQGLNVPFSWLAHVPLHAPPAASIIRRAARTWRALASVSWHEVLRSDAHHVVRSDWRAVAPDRVAYVIRGEGSAIVIGRRRWDQPGVRASWQLSAQDPPLHQPVPFWETARDAHVVGTGVDRGREVWFVSFYDPGTPGWFQIEIDQQSLRTLQMDMYATAHFMHDTYTRFNATRIASPA